MSLQIKLPSQTHDYYLSALDSERPMWKQSWLSIATEAVPRAKEPQAAEGVPNGKLLQGLKTHTVHEVSKTEN